MASVLGLDGDSVDYSIVDGEVVELVWDLKVIFSKVENIAEDGWKNRLVEFVKKYGLNKQSVAFCGKHAFIYWMEEQGLL